MPPTPGSCIADLQDERAAPSTARVVRADVVALRRLPLATGAAIVGVAIGTDDRPVRAPPTASLEPLVRFADRTAA